jgi:tyrosyl-tRNA synthetase
MSAQNLYDILAERGFVYQCTDATALRELLGGERPVSGYIGFDPTADSLHVGSLVPIMALVHMQRAGHRPIVILGAGTCMVGDPSGRTETRQLMTLERIRANGAAMQRQLAHFISFDAGRALMLNNADWLMPLNYIEFLREIGRHFSVNRMLTAESYRIRLETGLTFLEFNYQLLQAYDFYVLMRDHDCILQMGGQDQWGNIVAGTDLCRRMLNRQAYGLTFPLLMNTSGEKFGKSVAGAVWLSEERTPPFDFYQFWRNTEDADVERFLGLFTLLPMDEVRALGALQPPLLNRAKEILAYEATALAHGPDKARQAYLTALRQFGTADPDGRVPTSSAAAGIAAAGGDGMPSTVVPRDRFAEGLELVQALVDAGLVASKGEARRLIGQGGVTVNDARVDSAAHRIGEADLADGAVIVKLGKKRFHRFLAE